jgi:metal-responsive CopG/Arc/MetJ family transcriptional regulator
MKVAISVPDPIFREAEQLAAALNKSRSELYAEAIARFVGKHGARNITERLNDVYDRVEAPVDAPLSRAQLGVLGRETW